MSFIMYEFLKELRPIFFIVLFISIYIGLVHHQSVTDTYSNFMNLDDQETDEDISNGPIEHSVFDNNLVEENVHWNDVVTWNEAYNKNTSKNFPNIVLGYVTPWNSHGYDIAKWFAQKFTHISPVWLQVKLVNQRIVMQGTHDIDREWIKAVQKASKTNKKMAQIVPRLLFEGWTHQDFMSLMNHEYLRNDLAHFTLVTIKKYQLDGIVFEAWNQLPSADLIKLMPEVFVDVITRIRNEGFTVIFAIPPPLYQKNSPGIFRKREFMQMADHVDAFSLMTYDYSNFQNPGPNSPLPWITKCVEHLVPDMLSPYRQKLLVGMNMYGLDHSTKGGSHVLGHDYIKILKKYHPNFKLDDQSGEHYIEYKEGNVRHKTFYPSLYSIDKRVKLAEELGTGVSMWEIGQGLDYFYDLF